MQQKGYTFEGIARFMSERRLVITGIALRNHLQRATTKRGEQSTNRPRERSKSRDVPQQTSRPDATANGQVSTGGASGERIPIASGTPSGASPAATAARSLVQKDAATRSAREPGDGATATRTTEHSLSNAAPAPDAKASSSVSTGGASGERISITSGTPSGASPAVTAERSLAQKDAATRSAREPSDGATATHPTEHSVSSSAPDSSATARGSVSAGGASEEPIPIASGTAFGASPAATVARSGPRQETGTRSAPGATAARTSERTVSGSGSQADTMAGDAASTAEASGNAIPIASATAGGAASGGIARGSVAKRESAAHVARGTREGKALARSPAGVREGPARQSDEATGSGGAPSPSATSEPAKPAEEKHRGMFEVRKDTDDL